MDLAEVSEGATTFQVPERHAGPNRGPGKASAAFYNPAMALTRDISVLLAQVTTGPRPLSFLDGLAATGIRGLRVANEAPGWAVTLNDRSPRALEVAQASAQAAGLDVEVRRGDLNALLATSAWSFVELDPYGSPVPFLSLAVRAVRDGGLLAMTATDTTALHGVKRVAGRRRYMGEPPPRDAPGWKVAASRYLVGAVIREAARFDRAASPVLVHHHQHAIRAIVRIQDGAAAADDAVRALEEVVLCRACQHWDLHACPCGKGQATGPYAMGPLQDAGVLSRMRDRLDEAALAEPVEAKQLLDRLIAEAPLGPFYLDVEQASKVLSVPGPPPRSALIEALKQAGLPAARLHYSPMAIGYDGTCKDAMRVFEKLSFPRE